MIRWIELMLEVGAVGWVGWYLKVHWVVMCNEYWHLANNLF